MEPNGARMKKNATLSPSDFRRAIDNLCEDNAAELRRTAALFRSWPAPHGPVAPHGAVPASELL